MARIASVRIVMNHGGAAKLLKSEEVGADLFARAEIVRDAAGGQPDFEAFLLPGPGRVRAIVVAVTAEGKRAEATDRTLSNALDAARG